MRLPRPSVFSPRTFLLALVLSVAGLVLGGMVPLLGGILRLVGVFVAAFVVGLARPGRHYAETALAGALAAGLGFLLGTLTSGMLPFGVALLQDYGLTIAGVGVGTGAVLALAGHYFGRDLRAGLTREVP